MKSKSWVIRLTLAIAVLCVPAGVFAAGVGVYGSFDAGQAHFTDKGPNILTGDFFYKTFRVRQERSDFGLVVDSTVARDSLFNYRLNIGAGFGQVEVKKPEGTCLLHSRMHSVRSREKPMCFKSSISR